jgi:hypothetical protein
VGIFFLFVSLVARRRKLFCLSLLFNLFAQRSALNWGLFVYDETEKNVSRPLSALRLAHSLRIVAFGSFCNPFEAPASLEDIAASSQSHFHLHDATRLLEDSQNASHHRLSSRDEIKIQEIAKTFACTKNRLHSAFPQQMR